MANQNGQLILQALQTLEEPATVMKIVTHIADTAGVHPNDVKESVQETLNGGVRYGYIQRANRKYYAAPVDLDTIAGGEGSDPEVETNKDDIKETGEMEDRGGRRRRRRASRSRSRSRRGSRRRRRR
ncbi:uncharacterized protein LOC126753110 [Bactrocera neohumeralis]|uniref:uncharacterized protein LOC120767947 n=1 Tax=Bactrocera tryoni TaxID=59916 RepID=UPI001A96F7D4|nr:uncharacterized protein LOC120767947 [Bactrocera tryoni]XP_050320241.1 uncharacterized protein LOC126753110 [Bactrocera neohumeralis]